jgi:hypothetical protein
MQFQNIQLKDLGAGIDQLSSETSIPEGYMEKLVNWEPTPEGYLKKRGGYETVGGRLPLRVYDISSDRLRITLDPVVDVTSSGRTPLLIAGYSSVGALVEDQISADAYSLDPRVTFSGIDDLELIAPEQSGILSSDVSLALLQKEDGDSLGTVIFPDTKQLDTGTLDIEVELTEDVGGVSSYIIYKQRGISGLDYVSGPIAGPTVSVSASTHGLNSVSLQAEYYVIEGSKKVFIEPDTLTISPTGVGATFVNNTNNIYAVISRADDEVFQSISSGPTTTTPFFPIGTRYPMFQAWFLLNTGEREAAFIDAIEVDQLNQEARLVVENGSPNAISLIVTWEAGLVVSNVITLTDQLNSNILVGASVWGLNQAQILKGADAANRSGWIQHLDSYKSGDSEYLLAGSDRNLFFPDRDSSITPPASGLSPAGRLLVSTNQVVGPFFTGPSNFPSYPNYLQGPGGETGWLRFSIEWTGTYTRLKVPATSLTGSLSGLTQLYLTIQKCQYAKLNGVHKIVSASWTGSELRLDIDTPTVKNEDWDSYSGQVGIFSAAVSLPNAEAVFLQGDEINNSFVVAGTSTNLLILDRIYQETDFSGGSPIYITYRYASEFVPFRKQDGTDTLSIEGLLVGDSIEIAGETQSFEVQELLPFSTQPLTFINEQKVSVAAGITEHLRVGQKVLLGGSRKLEATLAVLESTAITFSDISITSNDILFLIGNSACLSRSYSLKDTEIGNTNVVIQKRWLPVPRPDASQLPWSSSSPFGRSSMVADSSYIVTPEVTTPALKWDNNKLTRSGIPRWPLHLFMTVKSSGSISNKDIGKQATVASRAQDYFVVAVTTNQPFVIGTLIQDSLDLNTYTVQRYEQAGADLRIYVDRTVAAAGAGLVRSASAYKYYYVVRKTDSNGYITQSACYGTEDSGVLLTAASDIIHKVVLPPTLEFDDKSRYELECYRTLSNSDSYFLVTRLSINTNSKYLVFTDNVPDDVLTDEDVINVRLLGPSLGTEWEEMPQGECMTTTNNRSVIGNLRTRPRLDLQWNLVNKNVLLADMVDVRFSINTLTYQFVSLSGQKTISGVSYDTGTGLATLTSTHGLAAGTHQVYIFKNTSSPEYPHLLGWYTATYVDVNTLTVQLPSGLDAAQVTSGFPDRLVVASNTSHIPVLIDTDTNYLFNGDSQFRWDRCFTRLAAAVRATQSLASEAGDIWPQGYISFFSDTSFQVQVNKSANTNFNNFFYVTQQGRQLGWDSNLLEVQTEVRRFPSRIAISYANYPEVFDAVAAEDSEKGSDSSIDVNPSDGQEIVSVVPFFGDSVFGQGSRENVLLVLKTGSLYLVDINAKVAGQPAVQKLETQGLGCDYPRSVASTRYGIQFANRAGIWKISQEQKLVFIGRRLDRLWEQELVGNIPAQDIPCAHNWRLENKWRLSLGDGNAVSYNHLREYLPDGYRDGSWTQLNNYQSLGFANLTNTSYMALSENRVVLLDNSLQTDCGGVIEAEALFPATDFGDSSVRKVVQSFQLQIRTDSDIKGLEVSTSVEMLDTFTPADTLITTVQKKTGLEDFPSRRIDSFAFSSRNKRGKYYQVRIFHGTKEVGPEIYKLTYKVAGLSTQGVTDAKASK